MVMIKIYGKASLSTNTVTKYLLILTINFTILIITLLVLSSEKTL